MLSARGEVKLVPRISAEQWKRLVARGNVGRKPLVVSEAFSSTDAVKTWTPESVAARFAETRASVAVDLPTRGSPYGETLKRHLQRTTVSEFVRSLPDNPGSYLAQAPLSRFPGLAGELGIPRSVVPPVLSQNLWIGNSTRSGLHFDMADGLLVQVHGVKTATLVPAGHFSDVYVYPDVHSKSRVDPNDFDESVFPRFAQLDRFTATLTPGDALFIPRQWWHHLVSDGISISVNAWFGRNRAADWPATVLRAGPAVWRQAGQDFVSLGILKRDFQQRLFSEKPTGLRLYEKFLGALR